NLIGRSSHVLLFERPAERAPVVGEHLPDALVVHLLVVQFVHEELVLLADLLLVTHTGSTGCSPMNLHPSGTLATGDPVPDRVDQSRLAATFRIVPSASERVLQRIEIVVLEV